MYILLAVLFACSCSAFAQFGTSSLAKDNLTAATTSAQARASDAVLYQVVGDSAQSNGKALLWIYSFYSQLKDSIYDVSVVFGFPAVAASTSSTVNASSAVGTPWVNSDVAMATAELHGGSQFRSANPSAAVVMSLSKGLYPPNPAQTVWLVIYTTSSSALVVAVDSAGNYLGQVSAVNEPLAVPNAVSLSQNYPNPFSASTAISFTLNTQQNVSLAVFNELGQQISTLANGKMNAGAHSVSFDASNLPQGVYFYKLTTGGVTETRQMIIVK